MKIAIAITVALALVVANPVTAALTPTPDEIDPAERAFGQAVRIGICWGLAATTNGVATTTGGPAPDMRVTPGREVELAQTLDRCAKAVLEEAQP